MMEHTSTPVWIHKKIKTYSSGPNGKVQNRNVDSSIKNSSKLFPDISPIPMKIETTPRKLDALENDTDDKLIKMCDVTDTFFEAPHDSVPVKKCKIYSDNFISDVTVQNETFVDNSNQNSTKSFFMTSPSITPTKKENPQKMIASLENEIICTDTHDDSEDIDSCSDIFQSQCSTESTRLDHSLADDVDISTVTKTLLEIRQAVPMYINKIKDLNIMAEWNLSETVAVKSLYKSSHGIRGPLDPEEVSFIKGRIEQFCKEYKINMNSVMFCMSDNITKFKFPNEIRLKLIHYLCKDVVNDRNPLTIYRAISKLGLRTGIFTETEVNFLIEMYHNYSGSYLHSVCGLLLNRHRSNIFKKFIKLKKKNLLGSRPTPHIDKKKPLKLQKLVLNEILNRIGYEPSRLKIRINSKTWKGIGRDCSISPALAKAIFICDIKPQIFANHPVKFNKFVKKLLYRIYYSAWKTWEEVQWKKLSDSLYNIEPFSIYATLRKIAMNFVPKEKWENFRDCAQHLYDKVLPQFENYEDENKKKEITLNEIIIRK